MSRLRTKARRARRLRRWLYRVAHRTPSGRYLVPRVALFENPWAEARLKDSLVDRWMCECGCHTVFMNMDCLVLR
jgi:hypothetical protein